MAPQWFKDKMPAGMVLDGELFAGNGRFQETVSYVRKMNPIDAEWQNIKYMVFDCPLDKRPFEDRIAALKKLVKTNAHLELLVQTPMTKPVDFYLKDAESQGYEGVMLRQPGSLYEEGRSHTLLKVKSFKDCEVTVCGYEKGKGRHKGRVGALKVRMASGVELDVGTGLSDAERDNPPAIGSIITVRYQELTKDGSCRFPVYVACRDYE
jgi:DNA ligase-1